MTTTCPTCNSELLTSNGQTFCPACLLQQGMKSSTYGGGPRMAWKPPEIEQLTAAFPQLEIQQLLGVGGMGAVFKVRQKELDRIAALKVLPGEMAADAGFTERFLREARLLASLSHPHIVTVYEFGQRDGIYFLLMEFIDGVTLRQALRAEPIKKLGSKETLAIVGQLCDALQFAHDEGVVHRDIKPENILIDKRGRVKIADFGLARLLGQSPTMPTLTRTHQLMGTPAYMAPEQIEGLPGIDHRADIYSMGVVFYELLTGELPLGRFSPPSERAETDVRLDEVVLRTLAREPDRRYQQASQVKTDVEALRGPAIVSSLATDGPKKKRRVGLFVSAFALGALLTPFLFAAMWTVMEWRWAESFAAQSERDIAARGVASRATAIAAEETRRVAMEMDAVNVRVRPTSEGGIMGGMDSDDSMSMGGMPGSMGSSVSSNLFDPGSAIVFDNSVPSLSAQLFNLTNEQREAVNTILKESHERYLKEEALHSIVSVDANGVQTTEISAFPDQLRAIENEMWTKLDDAVPVETQKEFRNRLNLYTIDGPNDDSGSMMGSGGSSGMSSMMDGGMGMSAGMMGASPGTGPGLLGWEPEQYPLKISISRSGRWFEWSTQSKDLPFVREKAPTLPSALQRFYREPGPWMAVTNARATYAAKNWMKLADYFTAGAMTREFLNATAFGEMMELRIENDSAAAQEWAARYTQQYLDEIARTPELAEMVGKAFADQAQGLSTPEINVEELIIELQRTAPSDVDVAIVKAAHSMHPDILKKAFAFWVLTSAVVDDDEFEFELENGEVSSYTETGDTASATLTIPNKPPVPIRFKRENGQWKIDAIGSSVRLLERLKQTKIWKQHAEIEAVLENARTAYAAKEWVKLLECFTRTGKYRWTLQTDSTMPVQESTLPEGEDDRRMEQLLSETGRWFILQAAAGKTDDQPLPNETQSREFRVLFDELLSCPAGEIEGGLIRLAESLPESLLDAGFAGIAIQSVVMPPETYRFEFDGCRVADVKLEQDVASASLVRDGKPPSPMRLLKQDGKWKIDSIGTPEELQQQVRISQQRQNGASPRAATETFRKAMADGRYQTALSCMTEDARNEWLGEMLIGLMNTTSDAEYPTHPTPPGVASRFAWSNDHFQIRYSVGGQFDNVAQDVKDLPEIRDRSLTADQRRKLAIGIAKRIEGPSDYLPHLLENRALLVPDAFAQAAIGEFEEVPDRTKPEKGAKKYRLQQASTDRPPLELDIIQIDGLWKLNTIIDPALKPWPLPAEEPTTPVEATPVDGATGVP